MKKIHITLNQELNGDVLLKAATDIITMFEIAHVNVRRLERYNILSGDVDDSFVMPLVNPPEVLSIEFDGTKSICTEQ